MHLWNEVHHIEGIRQGCPMSQVLEVQQEGMGKWATLYFLSVLTIVPVVCRSSYKEDTSVG